MVTAELLENQKETQMSRAVLCRKERQGSIGLMRCHTQVTLSSLLFARTEAVDSVEGFAVAYSTLSQMAGEPLGMKSGIV
jgi:hypothetical protein